MGFSVLRDLPFVFLQMVHRLKPVSSEAHVSRLVLHFVHTACTQADAPMMALGDLSAALSAATCSGPANPMTLHCSRASRVSWRELASVWRNTRVPTSARAPLTSARLSRP